jgi:hypothetical protein
MPHTPDIEPEDDGIVPVVDTSQDFDGPTTFNAEAAALKLKIEKPVQEEGESDTSF